MTSTKIYQLFKFSETLTDKIIFTHAIGEKYISNFFNNSFPFIRDYCIKNCIDFIIFTEPVDPNFNLYWQKCLYPKTLHLMGYKYGCYIDTDVVINPFSPNIFDIWDKKKFGVISSVHNLPFKQNYLEIKSRVARLRNSIDNNYPLNSSLTAPYEDIFIHHNIQKINDSITTGVFLFKTEDYHEFESLLQEFGNKYAIDNGEEIYLNILFNNTLTHKLDYRFQSLWIYEMAVNYPFLYKYKNEDFIINSFLTCLLNNYFLHFAGSWESWVWHYSDKVYKSLNKHSEIYSFETLEHKILKTQFKPLNK